MDEKNKVKSKSQKNVVAVAVLALMVLALFYVVNNRIEPKEETAKPISAVQELLIINLDTNYPNTPKEVVKMYSEITRCFYSEQFSDEELEELAKMSRQLFDDELAANQSSESYLRSLKEEIASYKQMNRAISSYSISSSADVKYYDYLGDEWAQLIAMYSIRTGSKIEPSKERYLLRKDATGHWKIYGFRLEELEQTGISVDLNG